MVQEQWQLLNRKMTENQWTFNNNQNNLSYMIIGNGHDCLLMTIQNDCNHFIGFGCNGFLV
jgi:hypothetical protein